MRTSTARGLAWAMGLTDIALSVAMIVLMFLGRNTVLPQITDSWTFANGFDVFVNMGVPVIGIVIATHRPGNAIGWLFLTAGLGLGLTGFSRAYSLYAIHVEPGSLPAPLFFGWLSNWMWTIPIALLPLLFLLYPTGHPPTPRWRPVVWLCFGVLAALVLFTMVFATEIWSEPFTEPTSTAGRPLLTITNIGFVASALFLLPVTMAAAVASLVARFRRSEDEERLQLKWFVVAAALVVITFVVTMFVDTPLSAVVFNLALLCLYAAIAVAMLRYRLYDIDVIIGKAVVYGLLAAFITVVYVIVVVVIGAAIGATEELSLVATAIVAIAFQPVRESARRTANRLVYGARATPYEVLSGFSEHVGEAFADEEILPRMARLLAEGTGATDATVWLRAGRDLRPAASWPANGQTHEPIRLGRDELPPFPEGTTGAPVRHGGELLGAITVAKPVNEPLRPHEEQLVSELAAQAGLVLRNSRLIEDLRASRQRLIAAQDEERRRLERDIHDGAQQQLVALAVKVRMAEGLVGTDEDREREALQEILGDAQDALDTLRDLARGIYPPVLADRGLAAAIEAQARRSPVPVTVEAAGLDRYPPQVEAAVYFCVSEALQNVAKYAEATHVRVLVRIWEGDLSFSVIDDGRGFDRSTTPLGMGLTNMADRIAALEGSFDVKSQPGRGTNVVGRIPLP